jgi:3-phosphoshikimate 1-carboxyvinyltransferase
VIRDAAELRAKESDRIALVAAGLRALGAACDEAPDGLAVHGPVRLHSASLDAHGDHRLAMAWAIAACLAGGDGPTTIEGADCVAVSYPRFFEDLASLTR